MKTLHLILSVTVFLFGLHAVFSGSVFGQEKEMVDLTNILCKDVMRSSGVERNAMIGFLNGYFLGKKGTSTFNPQKVAESPRKAEPVRLCLGKQ
jgi:hypothetical protein